MGSMSSTSRMTRKVVRVVVAVALLLPCGLATSCTRQSSSGAPPAEGSIASAKDAKPAKKAHVFRGKIEKIDLATKSLTVNGEDVEGWMSAMTMVYLVDKPEVLTQVAVGDQITATVYDGDFSTLHDVKRNPAK
jgi:Cu/Ag efflux protein CusF